MLKEHKKYLVINRLQKYIGQDKIFNSFEEYFKALNSDNDKELLTNFINLLTTNYSYFFREKIHFDFLAYYLKNKISDQKYVRIWSAACSTGEEAYSIAITVFESIKNIQNLDFKILATDISTKVLQAAKTGCYDIDKVDKSITDKIIKKYFKIDEINNTITSNSNLKDLITFRQLNLLSSYPFKKNFDIIFLRNIMIYLNKEEKEIILNKIYQYLKPEGFLIIGLSESLVGVNSLFKPIKHSIYKK